MQALTTTVFNLYLALVCAFSLLASVIIAGAGLSSMVNVVYPGPTEVSMTRFDDTLKQEVPRAPEVIAAEKAERAANQRFYEVRSMLHSFVYFLLSGIIFAVHWRLFRRRVALADLLAPATPTTKTKSK